MTELAVPGGALALTDDNRELAETYPGLDPTPGTSMMELLDENVGGDDGGLRFGDFDRIKIPPGGGLTWLVPDLEAGEIPMKELEGVVILWESPRSYWESKQADGNPPDCASRDGRTPIPGGLFAEGGEREADNPAVPAVDRRTGVQLLVGGVPATEHLCTNCPMAQFGTAINDDGTPGKGKACNERRLLYMIRPGEVLPSIVALSPMSIAPMRTFFVKLAAKRLPFHAAVIGLSLKAAEGGPGGKQKFSVAVPRLVRSLNPAERALTLAASEAFKAMFQRGELDQGAGITAPAPEETAPDES